MLKDFTIANLLDLNETIAKDLFEGKTYPWEVLPEIGDFILKLGQTLSEEEYDHPSEDVWIAKSAKVAPTACINGPVIIGKVLLHYLQALRRISSDLFQSSRHRLLQLPVSCQILHWSRWNLRPYGICNQELHHLHNCSAEPVPC